MVDSKDIKNGFSDALGDIESVREELKTLAADMRPKVLSGEDRKEFLEGLTQEEFDVLHNKAFALGPRGMTWLERFLKEASE